MANSILWANKYQPILRLGTNDLAIITEQANYSPLNIQHDDTILDIGAHIGAFSLWAAHNGARETFCFEPSAQNRILLVHNLGRSNIIFRIRNQAVTKKLGKKFILYGPNPDKNLSNVNYGMSSSIKRTALFQETDVVRTTSLELILNRYQADIMKIDIEFGEYHLDWWHLKVSTIKRFVVEWHFDKHHTHVMMAQEENKIRDAGYEVYYETDRTNGDQCLVFYKERD